MVLIFSAEVETDGFRRGFQQFRMVHVFDHGREERRVMGTGAHPLIRRHAQRQPALHPRLAFAVRNGFLQDVAHADKHAHTAEVIYVMPYMVQADGRVVRDEQAAVEGQFPDQESRREAVTVQKPVQSHNACGQAGDLQQGTCQPGEESIVFLFPDIRYSTVGFALSFYSGR